MERERDIKNNNRKKQGKIGKKERKKSQERERKKGKH